MNVNKNNTLKENANLNNKENIPNPNVLRKVKFNVLDTPNKKESAKLKTQHSIKS